MTDFALVSHIVPNRANPRETARRLDELAASIEAVGLLEPLVVAPLPGRPGWFVLIDGWRRWKALQLARIEEAPIVVRDPPRDSAESIVLALVADCQNDHLTPGERARAFGRLKKTMTLKQISDATGLSPSTISHHMNLLDLADESLAAVDDGRVPVGQAHEAIRRTRAATRAGRRAPGRTVTEPPWFTRAHPLWQYAAAMCGHGNRPRMAGGCGQCWEQAIRDDTDQTAKPATVRQAS